MYEAGRKTKAAKSHAVAPERHARDLGMNVEELEAFSQAVLSNTGNYEGETGKMLRELQQQLTQVR